MQTTVDVQEELWTGLPASSAFRQKKLTGLHDGGEAPSQTPERRTFVVEADDVVLLAAYHVVLQWYLDDVESLIGCWLASPSGPVVRASYVYSEDDDAIDGLLGEVARQLRAGRSAEAADGELWSSRRAPAFFYGTAPEAASLADHRVVIAAVAGLVDILMPPAAAQAVGIAELQRRFETVVSALLAGECTRVGELKARLGEAAEVPYRQLDEMQRRVIDLWARVLNIAEDSLDETSSYFEVGGTSLNAFKLVNRVRLELQRDISIRDIIENSTIQEFARLLLRD